MTNKSIQSANQESDATEALAFCRQLLEKADVHFTDDEVRGPSRSAKHNSRRTLIIFILRQQGYSFTRIGSILNRNLNVIKYLDKLSNRKDMLPHLEAKKQQLQALLAIHESEKAIANYREQIEYHEQLIEKYRKSLKIDLYS